MISYIAKDISFKECRTFPKEKLKQTLDFNPDAIIDTVQPFQKLSREQFIRDQCRAIVWENNNFLKYFMYHPNYRHESRFFSLLRDDDTSLENLSAMQEIIDNGLVSQAKTEKNYENLLIEAIRAQKYGYLKMLAMASEDMEALAEDGSGESALSLLVKKLQEAKINIKEFTINTDKSGKPSPPLFIQYLEQGILNASSASAGPEEDDSIISNESSEKSGSKMEVITRKFY